MAAAEQSEQVLSDSVIVVCKHCKTQPQVCRHTSLFNRTEWIDIQCLTCTTYAGGDIPESVIESWEKMNS